MSCWQSVSSSLGLTCAMWQLSMRANSTACRAHAWQLSDCICFPSIITLFAGFAYATWWQHAVVQQVFGAIMPIATGLMLGTALRLLAAMPRNMTNYSVFVLTFVLMGLIAVPLWCVLLISISGSIALRFVDRKA